MSCRLQWFHECITNASRSRFSGQVKSYVSQPLVFVSAFATITFLSMNVVFLFRRRHRRHRGKWNELRMYRLCDSGASCAMCPVSTSTVSGFSVCKHISFFHCSLCLCLFQFQFPFRIFFATLEWSNTVESKYWRILLTEVLCVVCDRAIVHRHVVDYRIINRNRLRTEKNTRQFSQHFRFVMVHNPMWAVEQRIDVWSYLANPTAITYLVMLQLWTWTSLTWTGFRFRSFYLLFLLPVPDCVCFLFLTFFYSFYFYLFHYDCYSNPCV